MYSGSNLDKKDLFSESDPFFTVSRINPDDSYTVVYRSDYIKDEPAPSWPPVTITSDKVSFNNYVDMILPFFNHLPKYLYLDIFYLERGQK